MAFQPWAGAVSGPLANRPLHLGQGTKHRVVLVLRSPCPATVEGTGGSVPARCPAQAGVEAQLKALGAGVVTSTTLVDTVTAEVTLAQARWLAGDGAVAQVVPDPATAQGYSRPGAEGSSRPPAGTDQVSGPGTTPGTGTTPGPGTTPGTGQLCGTQTSPLLEPEALQAIDAPQAQALGFDGAGVTVAVLADGLDPSNPDLLRNPAYGAAGGKVITQYQDFSSDGTAAPTDGAEAFGDASSIAAQGNVAYNLSEYVNPAQAARLPATGCWVKLVGAAPGADVMALKILPQSNDLTVSGILQAIQYAVKHGAKVINESFGFENFPDSALDVVRDADDAAVADGVTVVVSAGDAGGTNTIGSPATDPDVISVGATTTFQSYAQTDQGGFYNPAVGNGQWLDNNVAAFSSGGFSQSGNTINLVAPGDGNWALCSTDTTRYSGCADTLGGSAIGLQFYGGTSEAAPLTAAAAADVIQAYAQSHDGSSPSPALVKEILTSTATDIDAPATEQGAGLLNVLAAVQLARSLPSPGQSPVTTTTTTTPATGGTPEPDLLISPSQLNVVGSPGSHHTKQVTLTNTGTTASQVDLSTRTLTDKVYDTGPQKFTLDPVSPTSNTGTFPIWDGITEVYQKEAFQVPAAGGARLVLSAGYLNSDQTSDLHIALFEPDGTYAAYSDPQGLADYAQVEVANPPPGTWTALFFTEQDGATEGGEGTSGPVQWDASVWDYARGYLVSPSSVTIAPGTTVTANVTVTPPLSAGDDAESVVISSPGGQRTVPLTVRSTIPIGARGANFKGELTGGNGRPGVEAQSNTYFFEVPPRKAELDVSLALEQGTAVPLVAYLVAPDGQTVAYSSNYTLVRSGTNLTAGSTPYLQLYDVAPQRGRWTLVLEWVGPVDGQDLTEPFSGAVRFAPVKFSTNLPDSDGAALVRHHTSTFKVTVQNTGVAPEGLFVDPRGQRSLPVTLPNFNSALKTAGFSLPLRVGLSFPLYLVPSGTSEVRATLTRTAGREPVSFDMSYYPGDPDISPALPQAGALGANGVRRATATVSSSQLSPGVWVVNPDEVGPYPPGGAPKDGARLKVTAVTRAFDTTVTSSTQDFWQVGMAFSHYLYLRPGQSGTISVKVTPDAAAGAQVKGTLYLDNFVLASLISTLPPGAEELAAIPYGYTVERPGAKT